MAPHWIAVDWGTSNLRAWAMDQDGTVLDQATSPQGMATLAPAEFEPALTALIASWTVASDTQIVACGMVGSKQGWVEASYTYVPCAPAQGLTKAPTTGGLTVRVIGGVAQKSPADVMRGEETQIAGFLALNKDFDGVICLPGTHTKWVHVSAGEIVSFQTYMTGEIFGLLSQNSVLKHSVGDGFDDTAFATAVSDALSRPQTLAANLFAIRAAGLVGENPSTVATARLSGLLIGAELAGSRPYWLGQNVAIIGTTTLARLYSLALQDQGVPVVETDATRMTLEGLKAAWAQTKEPA